MYTKQVPEMTFPSKDEIAEEFKDPETPKDDKEVEVSFCFLYCWYSPSHGCEYTWTVKIALMATIYRRFQSSNVVIDVLLTAQKQMEDFGRCVFCLVAL